MKIKGSDILLTLDEMLSNQFDFSNLSDREKEAFFIGMSIAAEATEYMQMHNINSEGTPTSYNHKQMCLKLCKSGATLNGEYNLQKIQKLSKEGID